MESFPRFTAPVIQRLRQDILEAQGNEVLWVGRLAPRTRTVEEILVAARGNRDSVPALFPHMEKGDVVIHNHPSGELVPSSPDLQVASQLGNRGIGFWIINNTATEVYAVCEPLLLVPKEALPLEEASACLGPGGSLSRIIPAYEPRESQIALLQLFTRGFNEDAVVAAEAGTGVGKSFAYLIPSLLWAQKNKERIVISTATINLQQQLLEKDIPLAKKALKCDLKAVLVKGRRNYLCPERLAEELRDTSETGEALTQLKAIAEWAAITPSGDLNDLGCVPLEGLWGRVASDADACHGVRCLRKDGCFLARARKEAAGASILVVNHHLLFADLALRVNGFGFEATAVLPPFHRLVFDEAHNMEKSATSYFSEEFSRPFLFKLLGRLYRKRRNGYTGLVVSLQGLVSGELDFAKFPVLVQQIQQACEGFNTEALKKMETSSLRLAGPQGKDFLESAAQPLWTLQKPLLDLVDLCDRLAARYEEEDEVPTEVYELKSTARKLEALSQIIDKLKTFDQDSSGVYWLEKVRDSTGLGYVRLVISPLNVDQLMNKAVFEPYRSVLMTSATLTIRGKFGFWSYRIGLGLVEEERVLKGIFPSPYDYAHRVLLASPPDFPLPEETEYQYQLESYLPRLLLAAKGSALVLFTSYESMKRAWETARPILDAQGISVYKQGDEERSRLLDRFKREISSVLFATDSFWEGVDTPGDTLRLVVICRLPFRVPSEPIIAARMEDLKRQGKDPFVHHSLPEAVTRFKQGFGRLIRHTDDSGCVVVLDTRILRKHYGSVFVGALPATKQCFQPSEVLLKQVSQFLEESKSPDSLAENRPLL